MSNLATMIMEGSMGVSGRLKHTYGHEDGAALIAMESAEALRDIFEAEFYVPNTCSISAAMEGASCVEESSQAAIMEASIKDAWGKIRQFFITLKEKVRSFLHNIKRYLLGIFGNDEKWVKSYEKELNSLDIGGYKVKMYKYTLDIKHETPDVDELMSITKNAMNQSYKSIKGRTEPDDDDELSKFFDDAYKEFLENMVVGRKVDDDELEKALWSKFRNGATSETDKNDVSIASSRSDFIAALKRSSDDADSFGNAITKSDSAYNKCIKFIDDAQKSVRETTKDDNGEYDLDDSKMIGQRNDNLFSKGGKHTSETAKTNYLKYLRVYSSYMSKEQNAMNKMYTARKDALLERNKAYKKALAGAFAYARKNKKK